ncbi:hypothetical protein HPB48_017428 [Haemaphysalis longicornis]|uniref:Mutator-like transposase domain-containing protein n=1 Tax=Haemaphysalis longicornis TaxID=44386 RepID=A0A9J6GB28_HAELO|nr:hypothetical protein HPB48_017428 [Haemaphysalis longicornis]
MVTVLSEKIKGVHFIYLKGNEVSSYRETKKEEWRTRDRIDTTGESAERAKHAADVKKRLASREPASKSSESGTEFAIVDLDVISSFFELVSCPGCGGGTLTVSQDQEKENKLCAKLVLACSACGLCEERLPSLRVAGAATITPFEVNVPVMKGVQSIGKGVTALTDCFAAMNISHRGLHHKTYQGHMGKMVGARNAVASECEAASVSIITELGIAPGNVDVAFDGTWLTRGCSSHTSVACITEMHTGLVIVHVVLSSFCLGCSTGPKPDDKAYADWLTAHTPVCQENIDCKPGQTELEAALIRFRRSLEKYKLSYTTMLSDGDSRTFDALLQDAV